MTILRIKHSNKYTCISNESLRDTRMSLAAMGLHHMLLSYPDNWEVSINHLHSICQEGIGKIRKLINELKTFGYIERYQENKDGRFQQAVTIVHEIPITPETPPTEKQDPRNKKRSTGLEGIINNNKETTNQEVIINQSVNEVDFSQSDRSGRTDGELDLKNKFSSQSIRFDQKEEKKEKSSAKKERKFGDINEYSKATNSKRSANSLNSIPVQERLHLKGDLKALNSSELPRSQKIQLALLNDAFKGQCQKNHPTAYNLEGLLGANSQFETEMAIYLDALEKQRIEEEKAIEAKRMELQRQKEEERIKAIEASKTKEEKVAETIVGLKRQIEVQRRGLRKLPEGFHAVIQKKIDTLLATIERLQGGLNARTAAV